MVGLKENIIKTLFKNSGAYIYDFLNHKSTYEKMKGLQKYFEG